MIEHSQEMESFENKVNEIPIAIWNKTVNIVFCCWYWNELKINKLYEHQTVEMFKYSYFEELDEKSSDNLLATIVGNGARA